MNKFVYPTLAYFLILLICMIILPPWHPTGSMKRQANYLFIVLLFLLSYMYGFLILKMYVEVAFDWISAGSYYYS